VQSSSFNTNELDRVWKIPDGARLEWSHFDEESVLFNPLSGQTHLLTVFAIDILEHVLRSSAAGSVLVDHMAVLYQIEPEAGFQEQVLDSLDDLHDLGLVESMEIRENP